jgi:hypothetical protein
MCLYCLAEANSLENVLPAAFGEFKDAPNLNNYICAPCNNGPLGLLDQQIARCGPEALLRKFYAVEGRAEHAKVNPFARGSAGGKRLESSAIDGTADRVLSASMETLARLREQGKIRHVGLSNVTLEHLERARKIVPIVSVQNRYSFADREWDYLLNHCEQNEIVFIPWAPLGQNRQAYAVLEKAAKGLGATPATGGTGLASSAVHRHSADSRDILSRSCGGERCSGRTQVAGRVVQGTVGVELPSGQPAVTTPHHPHLPTVRWGLGSAPLRGFGERTSLRFSVEGKNLISSGAFELVAPGPLLESH